MFLGLLEMRKNPPDRKWVFPTCTSGCLKQYNTFSHSSRSHRSENQASVGLIPPEEREETLPHAFLLFLVGHQQALVYSGSTPVSASVFTRYTLCVNPLYL